MPVRFKVSSEYNNTFKWHDSRKSASFKPSPEQEALEAGLKSADLSFVKAEQREPQIQHKRYPVDPASKITHTTKMYIDDDPSEESSEPVAPPKPEVKKKEIPAPNEVNGFSKDPRIQPVRVFRSNDERKDKGKPHKPEPKKDKSKTYKLDPKEDKPLPSKMDPAPKEAKSAVKDTEPEKENLDKDQAKADPDLGMKYRAGLRRKDHGPKRLSEYQRQFAWKAPTQKESPLIAAEQMIYNSNAIPSYVPDKVPRKSEYDSQFQAWNQVQPTQQEMLVEHAKKDQEAKQKKKVSRGKRKKSSQKVTLSPDQMPAAGVPSLQMEQLKAAQNPQKPFFPSGPIKKWKSEYRSNYRDPRLFGYMEGVWRGADPPHIQPRDDTSTDGRLPAKEQGGGVPEWFAEVRGTPGKFSENTEVAEKETKRVQDVNWFKEVVELRKKAQEYQKRARGTHFSREHLAQLLAQQAKLWDQESETSTSTITPAEEKAEKPKAKPSKTYTKETAAKQQAQLARQQAEEEERKRKGEQEEKQVPPIHLQETQPVRRKLAWPSAKAESESSIGSIPTPEGYHSHTSPRDSAVTDSMEDDEGRVPTPRITKTTEPAKVRHHLTRTTPAIGGALLTSPNMKAAATSPIKKSPVQKPIKLKASSPKGKAIKSSVGAGQQASDGYRSDDEASLPARQPPHHRGSGHGDDDDVHCNCGAESAPVSQVKKSPSAGIITRDPDPLSDAFPLTAFQRHSENFYETSPTRPRVPDDRAQLTHKTWAGMPLERGRAPSPPVPKKSEVPPPRKPSEAWTVPSGQPLPSKPSDREKRVPVVSNSTPLQHQGRTEARDDDVLSNLSTLSSRSSCSLASEVLERARRRRDEFWGNQNRVPAK
ncbi:nuclear protein MDM1-like isoform X2 [Ptychodera flava]|uniref:nuclear protein MDM1-like isoform X2 n=1 Tax=Ptychodera flava TaxID=63121 RepID=UPI00396AA79B